MIKREGKLEKCTGVLGIWPDTYDKFNFCSQTHPSNKIFSSNSIKVQIFLSNPSIFQHFTLFGKKQSRAPDCTFLSPLRGFFRNFAICFYQILASRALPLLRNSRSFAVSSRLRDLFLSNIGFASFAAAAKLAKFRSFL